MSYYKKVIWYGLGSLAALLITFVFPFQKALIEGGIGGSILLAYLILGFNAFIVLETCLLIWFWWSKKIKANSFPVVFNTVSLLFVTIIYSYTEVYSYQSTDISYALGISLVFFMLQVSMIFYEGQLDKIEKSTANK